MAEQVDPRTAGSEFDGIESGEPGSDSEVQRHWETGKRQENPGQGSQVDPRKEYSEFDGIRSSG
ncbi:MAG TPA: hypothetical protein VNF45_03850 [Candidatus Binataceae bacterium]|nr:hypothetical protein [Candidatus Binataceae bacterium]